MHSEGTLAIDRPGVYGKHGAEVKHGRLLWSADGHRRGVRRMLEDAQHAAL